MVRNTKIPSNLSVKKRIEKQFKFASLKICLIYLVSGILWIVFSDRIAHGLIRNEELLLLVNTYKGIVYVLITAYVIYILISKLLSKSTAMKLELDKSYDELEITNEELQAYIQQLAASEEELRNQYEQILEFDRQLSKSEEKYKTLINQMQLGLALYEGESEEKIEDYHLIETNDSHERITGLKKEDIMGNNITTVFREMETDNMNKLVHTAKTGEPTHYERYQPKTERYYEIIAYRPKHLQLAIIVNDITKRKTAEAAIKIGENKLIYLSQHDQLTGLYNRRFFEEEVERLDAEYNLPFTITMADINGLKLINDSFGHAVGDEIIKRVATIIKEGCREQDVICRIGGDEFVILSTNTDGHDMELIIDGLQKRAAKEKVEMVNISISFGHETKHKQGESVAEVLKKAEDYMYRRKLYESPSMRGKTITTIINTLYEKNKREEEHSRRVSSLCEQMGRVLGMKENEIKELKTVGLLHDIGKIVIEEEILNKDGKLTKEEWKEIKRHPEIGYRILSTVNDLSEMAEYVLAHHEKWDGNGYPKGLKGEEIPFKARIITIADAYDAMISERSYRKAGTREYAISELKNNVGIQFCPELVKIFIEQVLNEVF